MKSQLVGVGIVGAGAKNIATDHQLPASLHCPSVKVIALADLNPEVDSFAAKYKLKAYRNFNDLLADPEIDMVQIATPDWLHCEQASAALQAGKFVLLQKPPCLNSMELQQLRKLALQYPGHLKIALNNRETALVRTLRKSVADGLIGELRAIRIKYRGHRFPIANPNSPYLKNECGGVWLHNGLHWLDEACFVSGKTPVSLDCRTTRNPEGSPEMLGEGPNYWSALFDLDGVNFLFEYNTMLMRDGMPGGMQRAFIGTAGELRVEYGSGTIMLYQNNASESRALELLPMPYYPADSMVDSFCFVIENFARQIIDGTERAPVATHSLDLTECLLAVPRECGHAFKVFKEESLK